MKPTYLIPDPTDPKVRVRTTRALPDLILDLFTRAPDHGAVEVAASFTAEPHARYQRTPDGQVKWYGRVKSHEGPDYRTVTDKVTGERRRVKCTKVVLRSPNEGEWVDMGTLEPLPTPEIDKDPGPPEDAPPEWEEAEWGSKWDLWYAQEQDRKDRRDAINRLVEAGLISAKDIYPHLR